MAAFFTIMGAIAAAATGGVRPYSATSPWNTPIASSPVICPNSQHYIALLASEMPLRITTNEYDETLYETSPNDPLVTVALEYFRPSTTTTKR